MKMVTQIQRFKESDAFSVELINQSIFNALHNKINLSREVLPAISKGILNRIRNLIFCYKLRNRRSIFHITGDSSFVAIALKKKSFVITFLDCVSLQNSKGLKRLLLKYFYYYLPAKRAKELVFISEFTKQSIIGELSSLQITGTVIAPPLIIPQSENSSFYNNKLDHLRPFALHIGSTENKNLIMHVKSMADTNLNLLVIGNINEAAKKIADARGINIQFFESVPRELIYQAYSKASLLLFASTYEGFGMPIIEAQHFGIPVITSNVSSMPEVAGPNGAIFVSPLDYKIINQSIKDILENENLRSLLIREGKKNAQKYKMGSISNKYLKLYRKLLINS